MSIDGVLRVVVAEDSGLPRELLVRLLTENGMVVGGQAGSLPELLAVVAAETPDLVISDIRMPPTFRDEGIEAAARIRELQPTTGLLILTHYPEAAYAVRLLEIAGRSVGYLVKDRVQDTARFLEAARRVAAGETVIDSHVVQEIFQRPRPADPLDHLAPSERQILALIAEGHSNAAIAPSDATTRSCSSFRCSGSARLPSTGSAVTSRSWCRAAPSTRIRRARTASVPGSG